MVTFVSLCPMTMLGIRTRVRTPSIKCTTLLITTGLLNIKNLVNKMSLSLTERLSVLSLSDDDLRNLVVTAKARNNQLTLTQFFCQACALVRPCLVHMTCPGPTFVYIDD